MSQSLPTGFDPVHIYRGEGLADALPGLSSITSMLADRARAYGSDPYITAVSADNQITTVSYGEMDKLSRRSASWLRRELGVRPGRIVALLPVNDIPSVVTMFGLLRSGCAILLLNPADPPARLIQQATALGAMATLCASSLPADICPGAIPIADISNEPASDSDPPIDLCSDALFLGTSGSTAASKLVAQSHYNIIMNAEGVRRHHGLGRRDRFLGCLPIHHVNGLHFTIFATLYSGGHAILVHAFDPFRYPRLIERFRPRIASVVPSILEALLGTWRRPVLPSEFKYFVSAAAPLAARTVRDVVEKLGAPVLQGYGLTETTNFSTTMPADLPPDAYRRLMIEAEIPSIGVSVYGNEVAVLGADGAPVAPGDIGEICMRGYNVMSRYAGNVAATAEAFRGGWFHSQDLGFAIEDRELGRRFIVITGRTKNIAKVRGESVSLDEMERVLCTMPYVRDAACIWRPHRFLGDEIVAAIVLADGAHHDDAAVRDHLRTIFAPAALPGRIIRIGAIPRTSTGKILRGELAQRLGEIGEGQR